jgi:hypothetical protein
MTREEALQVLIIKANKGAFVEDIINQIFDEYEKELKQAYIDGSNSNNGLIKFYLKQIGEKDKEIEKLKTIIEEAIRKPMGVEPHSWSDYKMQKDNA